MKSQDAKEITELPPGIYNHCLLEPTTFFSADVSKLVRDLPIFVIKSSEKLDERLEAAINEFLRRKGIKARGEHDIWYHGTELEFALSIYKHGISLEMCPPFSDLGRGFYLTNDIRFARNRPCADCAAILVISLPKSTWEDKVLDLRRTRELRDSLTCNFKRRNIKNLMENGNLIRPKKWNEHELVLSYVTHNPMGIMHANEKPTYKQFEQLLVKGTQISKLVEENIIGMILAPGKGL